MRMYKAWLPESVLLDSSVDDLLADLMRHWSAKWFTRKGTRLLARVERLASQPVTTDRTTWLALDGDVAIGIASRDEIAAMMLNAQSEPALATNADRRVLSDLATTALDDLCRRLAQMFRLPPGTPWR